MNHCSMKREFYMDIDDIVDELLTALKAGGWTLSKMNYELCKLTATSKERKEHKGESFELTFGLIAIWRDMEDLIELEIVVEEAEQSWTEKECITKCSAVIGAIKEEKTYQSLYAQGGGMDFDNEDFESNN
ncbi:MAG TPA: hypothetical protein V6C86_26250 [Oculatellaceae cyanobacterium]